MMPTKLCGMSGAPPFPSAITTAVLACRPCLSLTLWTSRYEFTVQLASNSATQPNGADGKLTSESQMAQTFIIASFEAVKEAQKANDEAATPEARKIASVALEAAKAKVRPPPHTIPSGLTLSQHLPGQGGPPWHVQHQAAMCGRHPFLD
jgi:hypothetical protein